MGQRGPQPKPTALRVLHGDEKRRINADEPQPRPGLPLPPGDMAGDVRAVWDYVVEELGPMGLAKRPDVHQLRAYCEAVVAHATASRIVAKDGILQYEKKDAVWRKHPAFFIQTTAARTMLVFGREFGLTPASRVQFKAGEVAESYNAERLLS